jgi:hypothetical protein
MASRGGVVCDLALRCSNVKCTKYKWKQTAAEKKETHCLCGQPFTREEYKPRGRGTSARGAGGADERGQAQAAPKANAKAKAKAKPKAQAAPTGQAPWQTSSPTGGRSKYELSPALAARAAKDDVVLAEERLRWCRMVGRTEQIREAEKMLRKVCEERDEALPPKDRIARLRAQRDEAEKELAEQERAVAKTEQQVYDLECRLHQERDEVVGIQARLESLDRVIEQVELELPPEGWAQEAEVTPKGVTQQLMQVQRSLIQLQGGDLPGDVFANMQYCLRVLDSYGEALDRDRREREAQEAADARLARALAEKEAREQAATEDADVDLTGEDDFTEVINRGRAKKGKGHGKGWTRGDIGSPTVQQSGRGPDIGPLATLGRIPPPPPPLPGRDSRAASEPRGRGSERRRSPRRQPTGTPAQPGAEAAGVLGGTLTPTATGVPTDVPFAAGRPAESQVAAPAVVNPPGATSLAGQGQSGAGGESPGVLNPGGRPPLT